jgi:chromatin segregation and condensation protein Rec8/ScpA/Scc1 (kleisin family)
MPNTKRDDLLRTLSEHPGFKELVAMFDEEAEVLRHRLENERQKSIEDYYFLQAGLRWLQYAKRKSEYAVKNRLEVIANQSIPDDLDALQKVLSQYEGV